MKYLLAILFVLPSACSELTETESQFVGTWSWFSEKDNFKDSGHLTLNRNGTYTYLVEYKNPTETLVESFEENENLKWYLLESKVCLSKGVDSKAECKWEFIYDSSGKPKLSFIGITGKVNLSYGL